MKTYFERNPFDQLKENGVCIIPIQLSCQAEDKQPISSLLAHEAACPTPD